MTARLSPEQMARMVQENMGVLPENLRVSLPIKKSLLGLAADIEQDRVQSHEALAERVTQTERKVSELQKLHGDDHECTFSAKGVTEISLFLKAVGKSGTEPEGVLDAMRGLIAELDTESSSVEEKVAAVAVISACRLTDVNTHLRDLITKQAHLIETFTTEMSAQNNSLREENRSLSTKVSTLSEQVSILSEQVASRLPALPKVAKQLLPIVGQGGQMYDLAVAKGASFKSASSKDQRSSSRTGSTTKMNGSEKAANGMMKEELQVGGAVAAQADDVGDAHVAAVEEYVKSMDLPPKVDVERQQPVSRSTPVSTTIDTTSATASHDMAIPSAGNHRMNGSLKPASSTKKTAKRISFAGEPGEYTPSKAETTTVSAPPTAKSAAAAVVAAPVKPTVASSDSTPAKKSSGFKVDAPAFHPSTASRPAITLTEATETLASEAIVAPDYVPGVYPPVAPVQTQTAAAVEAPAAPRQLASPITSPIRDVTNVSAPVGAVASFMERLPANQRAHFAQMYAKHKGPN